MKDEKRIYLAIDLKSFYASVECKERNLDPMDTNLVVADSSRTQKTICLAVSPSLKKYGVKGRPRLFEVEQVVKQVNTMRKRQNGYQEFTGSTIYEHELKQDATKSLDYVVATPRMAHYIQYSTKIYEIYLRYIAPEDIHVYSIDEVFMDVTSYLKTYHMKPRELAKRMMEDVLNETGITATAGIGTNLYLCKVAMDIVAKHMDPKQDGVRIAALNERLYRQLLWTHRPLTDFWRVGKGYAKKLEEHGMYTMGDIARLSLHHEDLLYDMFGINAELLIDHAWGYEPCTIEMIKAYQPATKSLGSGQVLHHPYTNEKAKLVLKEMMDQLALDLVEKGCVSNQLVLTVGYDIENLTDEKRKQAYHGEIKVDAYGRKIPKQAHGTRTLKTYTSSSRYLMNEAVLLYEKITNPSLLIRRLQVSLNHVVPKDTKRPEQVEQYDLFTNFDKISDQQRQEEQFLQKEEAIQKTIVGIKKKFGKNAILKGMNLDEEATGKQRNETIGGHKA